MGSATSQGKTTITNAPQAAAKEAEKKFIGPVKPVWCAGCGDYAVLFALRKALVALEVPPEQVVICSGIGCSSRLPAYVGVYGFHGVHGRGLPAAIGAYVANPDLLHLVVGGDGDIFSIGGGHLAHAARRNPNITLLVMDNEIYGLTKGQPSPTTPADFHPKSMPMRLPERPLNPASMCLAYGVSFFARTYSGLVKQMTEIVIEAIRHPGFAVVQVLSPCRSFKNSYDAWNELTTPLPEDHDVTNLAAAMALAADEQRLYTGIFYKHVKPTLHEIIQQRRKEARSIIEPDLNKLFEKYA